MNEIQSTPGFTSDAIRPRPTLAEKRFERDLHVSQIAQEVARLLYTARHFHYYGNGIGTSWERASAYDRMACQRLAEEVVSAASDLKAQDALRQVRLGVQDTLAHAEWIALLPDEDHSQRHLIAAALQRMREHLLRIDPFAAWLGHYKAALRGETKR
jgi:hypothetical protein